MRTMTILGITVALCLAAAPLGWPVLPRALPTSPWVSAAAFAIAVLTAVGGAALLVGARRRRPSPPARVPQLAIPAPRRPDETGRGASGTFRPARTSWPDWADPADRPGQRRVDRVDDRDDEPVTLEPRTDDHRIGPDGWVVVPHRRHAALPVDDARLPRHAQARQDPSTTGHPTTGSSHTHAQQGTSSPPSVSASTRIRR